MAKMILRSFYFILILAGLVCLSCEEKIGGLVLENKTSDAYRFTGNFYGSVVDYYYHDGYVTFESSFDTIIQPGKSFVYDNSDDTLYGNFQVHVYDLTYDYFRIKSTAVELSKPSAKESVSLSWDGTDFSR